MDEEFSEYCIDLSLICVQRSFLVEEEFAESSVNFVIIFEEYEVYDRWKREFYLLLDKPVNIFKI